MRHFSVNYNVLMLIRASPLLVCTSPVQWCSIGCFDCYCSWLLLVFCVIYNHRNNYLRQGGNVFARLCLFVCLFVCVSARQLKKLWMDLSGIFWECREWQKPPVIQFWGWSGRNPGFWITLKFSLPLLSIRHKGNRCQTEDGAAT